MKVAVAQLEATWVPPAGDEPRRGRDDAGLRDAAVAAVREAAALGAEVVVLPEYTSGWCDPLDVRLAQPEDGEIVTALRDCARASSVTVVAGVVLPGAGAGRARNVALVIAADGEIVGRYVKTHLYDAYGARESDVLDAGDPRTDGAPLVVQVPTSDGMLSIGVATCYDLRFPEVFRALMDAPDGGRRPDLIAVGAAWAAGEGKADQLRVLVRARAIESTAYVALASQAGAGRVGGSVIVDPRGVVLAEVTGSEGGRSEVGESEVARPDGPARDTERDGYATRIAVADLSNALVDEVRTASPVLAHRRYRVLPDS